MTFIVVSTIDKTVKVNQVTATVLRATVCARHPRVPRVGTVWLFASDLAAMDGKALIVLLV